MSRDELLVYIAASVERDGYITFTDAMLAAMDTATIEDIEVSYGMRSLMRLPDGEVRFFTWLYDVDRAVWDDLWSGDETPYLVSLAFLSELAGENVGRPWTIRDLVSVDNYYFAPSLLIEKESDAYIAAVRDRFASHQPLTAAQALALEASVGPVDIWHFAYTHNLPLDKAKGAVASLVDDRILLHVPSADHLVQYFDVE